MLKFFHKIRLLLKKKHSISVFTKSVKFYRFILQISELGQLKRKKKTFIAPLQKKVGQTMLMFSSNQLK